MPFNDKLPKPLLRLFAGGAGGLTGCAVEARGARPALICCGAAAAFGTDPGKPCGPVAGPKFDLAALLGAGSVLDAGRPNKGPRDAPGLLGRIAVS